MDVVVAPETLLRRLDDPRLRIVDCRFDLTDPEAGWRGYLAGHLPGAVYAHLERDLSAPRGPVGGRHPLPPIPDLVRCLEGLGIGNDTWVVAYDDSLGDKAARLWWILRYLGHDAVQLLDGGLPAWQAVGGPLSTDTPRVDPARFVPHPRPDRIVTSPDEVFRAAREGRLVDSRTAARYRGDEEPLDPVAGHIPGAKNREWQRVFGPDGRLLPPEQLARRFADLGPEPVVYCGSGVTACVNALAMERAGLTPRVYVGSWSDWIAHPDRPVAVGAEWPDPEAG
jgi:thiosulfate/3-mercaptopyruvate sulfurtransferase